MPLNVANTRALLATFNFKLLFIEELGWNHHDARLEVPIDSQPFTLTAFAEKRGMAAFVCTPGSNGKAPDYPTRRRIERQVTKSAHEHLIIFVDERRSIQVWQWVRREQGKPAACREHTYHVGQPGESLIQKLQTLVVSLEEEESLTLPDVTDRARRAFDVERVTKRFYDRFKAEHAVFLEFLQGIPDEEMERWYISVMLNRLMFIYFIQKKGFLDDDRDYLKNKLVQCRKELGKDRYYRDFLCPLFFEGFAKQKNERSDKARQLLGEVPYLNGGIFMRHQIEQLHGKTIAIPDKAFEKLFEFFDAYHWHLDERPLRRDNEINPDVLGYIFEKYINQKQMGAYYTKEDITEYISKNTVIPFLFDAAREKCKVAFEGERSVWQLLREDPDRYIYSAVRHGTDQPLPAEITNGLNPPTLHRPVGDGPVQTLDLRRSWNKPAPAVYALPTEIWREVVARRKRYEEVRGKLAAGEVSSINDLITYNLDIRQYAQDVIENCEGPELLVAFWRAIKSVTLLDPACGSGAFLFAALNILEPLYEACLERMRFFLEEWGEGGKKHHPNYYKLFTETLKRVNDHPNYRYFILKSAIVNNLYGVDIMEEAVEICKLRLFLKLVAQIERAENIEPLPDIDFNIRAGNSLVGFASLEEVRKTQEGTLGFGKSDVARIEEEAEIADRAFRKFREMQTEQGMNPSDFTEAKEDLRGRLKKLTDELDRFLAREYGVDPKRDVSFQKWRKSHQPFHWFAEFYGILNVGGFDVIIGNPPYVEYRKVRGAYSLPQGQYASEHADNLYAFCMERSCRLLTVSGWFGMIVPTAVLGLDETVSLRNVLLKRYTDNWCSTYAIRPSKLFDGVDQRLCIYLGAQRINTTPCIWSSRYHHWNTEERPVLFQQIDYTRSFLHDRLKRIPQVGSPEAASILQKLESKGNKTAINYYSSGKHGLLMHYHRSPRYWIRAMDFEQYFKSPTRSHSIHHFRDLYFEDEKHGRFIGALYNSTLFFFWFISVGNGRNITGTDVEQIPVGEVDNELRKKIAKLFERLMLDYDKNSFRRERQDCTYQEFRPSLSKPILDEIDSVLARHYGFTEEELDFIINYDIKYRMGQDTREDEAE